MTERHLPKIFLAIVLVAGSLMLLIAPPMTAPDENTHFLKAYGLAHGSFLPVVENGVIGNYFPPAVFQFAQENAALYHGKLDVRYSFAPYYFDSWLKRDVGEPQFFPFSFAIINPFGYLFSALGMFVGMLSMKSFATPYNLLLFGRVFNFIFYASVMYTSIKTVPKYKRTMFVLALMPMSVFQGISLSYDAVLIPSCFLLFATVMKLRYSDQEYVITKADIVAILVSAVFLAGVKTVYALLLLALFTIPQSRFGIKKRYWTLVGITAAVAAAVYVVPALANRFATAGVMLVDDASVQQKQYLLTHLDQIQHILLNTFHQSRNFHITGFFGILGELDTNFPVPVVILFYVILLYVVILDSLVAGTLGGIYKGTAFLAVVSIALAMYYAMYVSWTSQPGIGGIGVDYVTGVQGRYFIPLALFVCSLLGNRLLSKNRVVQKLNDSCNAVAVYTGAICCALTVFTLYARFWN